MFTYNQYNEYKKHYVPKAKSIYVKKYCCKWNLVTTQFDISGTKHFALMFNSSKRLLDVLSSINSWEVEKIDKPSL